MATYKAPLRDMRFVLHEVLDASGVFSALPGYEEASQDLVDAVLEEGARICEGVIAPTNRTGDAQGCRFEDGVVTTPEGFKEAYRTLVEGGWNGLACDPAYGGQGLPHTISVFFEEMLQSSNLAFSLYPGLTHGAYIAMRHHASDELKERYLPKMVEGTWTGVMCLTESHCGTDLGLLRTRAEPAGDGSYRVSGTKIFITGGEQDLTENIIHLVLARLPDAPPGVKGISMFLVPKFLVNADGSLGERNTCSCGSIEHKMGIKGASTCVMNYEGATGWLVGEPNRGLHAMFSMMNHERLMVGQEGLAVGESAYQSAVEYARDRVQGRSLSGVKNPEGAADPIIVHPDIRRLLLTARAYNEGARALLGWVSLQVDVADRHPDAEVRQRADDLVSLLTPVIKAYFTDAGSQVANECQQVFGGHGYITEWGMEQHVRDARIAQIYEGANGIHALDLVGRKLPMHGGRLLRGYVAEVRGFIEEHRANPDLEPYLSPVAAGLDMVEQGAGWIAARAADDPEEVGATSYEFLRLLALTSLGHMWARSAAVALEKAGADNTGFYQAKLITARFFMKRLMPLTTASYQALQAGSDVLMELDAEAF